MAADDTGGAETGAEGDGLTVRLSRMALRSARAAARSGRTALTTEAERAIDGVLAGPMPETVARSMVEHRVLERMLAEWLEAMAAEGTKPSPERERLEHALEQAATASLAEKVIHSEPFKRALAEVLESPEVRRALTQQTAGFGSELASSLRRRARAADDRVESKLRHAFRRHPRPAAESAFGGLGARGIAIAVDAVLAHTAFLVAAGSIALIASLANAFHSTWVTGSLMSAGWALVVVGYFVVFWSATGQTPGMRLLRLRVLTASGRPPSVWRSLLRFVGLILAIVPLFAGFLPVPFDDRRRALQDYLAGTGVVAEP